MGVVSSLLVALAACEGQEPPPSEPVVSEIAPVSPVGSISGFVYDALTDLPLEGVNVAARVPQGASPTTAMTAADGSFLIEGVPASANIGLRYQETLYFDALDNVTIPSSAGNLAQDNGVGFSGPIGLLPKPATGAYAPDVVVRAAGVAVPAAVTAHLGVAYLVDGQPRGSLFATVSDEGSGRYSLGGLPDFSRLVAVLPGARLRIVIVPDDATYSSRVLDLSIADALSQGTVVVEVAAPDDGGEQDLVVLDSNVRDLMDDAARFPSVLAPGTPVTVEFSAAVDPESFFATAVNDRGQSLTTASTVSGGSVSLDITGVADGDEVYVYLEALPAEPIAATGPLKLVQASGFFVTPASQGLGITAYDAARKNNALRPTNDVTQLLCPADAGAFLWLELTEHVGARDEAGNPVPANGLLPIRVTSTSASVPSDHPLNPANGGLFGRVVERTTGAPASGFTRWVRVNWSPIATDQPAGNTTTYQIKLVFNDASLGSTGQNAVVRFPSGAPVESLQAPAVQVAVTEAGCAPPAVP